LISAADTRDVRDERAGDETLVRDDHRGTLHRPCLAALSVYG
jgi:hypothetical protein